MGPDGITNYLEAGFHITAALVAGLDERSPPVAEGLAAFALSCP